MGDLTDILLGCSDFGRLLENFLHEPTASTGFADLVQQAQKLSQGLAEFQHRLQEVQQVKAAQAAGKGARRTVDKALLDLPSTLEVQELLRQLDTINGTIRALDEMMAAESIPLADCFSIAQSAMLSPETRPCVQHPGEVAEALVPTPSTVPAWGAGRLVQSSIACLESPSQAPGLDLMGPPPAAPALAESVQAAAPLPAPEQPQSALVLWQEDEMEVAQPEEPQDFRGPALSGRRLANAEDTVQVASLLCSPGSPSSPALQDAPPGPEPDPSLFRVQVVPVGSENSGEAATEIGDGGDRDLALALPARPLPNEIPPAGPMVPLPEAPGRRVVARACKRRSALPAVPRLPPLPDGDLIESFSDNPLQNALQEPGPSNGQESCMPEEARELSPHRELERKPSGSDALQPRAPRAPSEPEAGLHAVRSPGFKELKELNLPPASTPRDHPKPKRALTSFAGKHVIDVTDFDVGPNPKRRREGAKSSGSLKGQAGNAASGSYGSQRSSRLRKPKPQKDPRRAGALLFSQRMSQLSQSLSQKLKANGHTPRRSIRVRKGGWILARGPQGSDPNPGKPEEQSAPLRGLPPPLTSAPSAPERPDVLFTGFARSDLHALRTSVNLLGGLAVNSLTGGGNGRTNVRVVVQCTLSDAGQSVATKRSLKYMEGVLSGAWVLSSEWVHSSLRAGHWLPEVRFQLAGDLHALGGPSRGRNHGPELFQGCRFHFVAIPPGKKENFCLSMGTEEEGRPTVGQLCRLVRKAGAQVLEAIQKVPDAEDDPPHLAAAVLSSRHRRRPSATSSTQASPALPRYWWRRPIVVNVPEKESPGNRRSAKLAKDLGWASLPAMWLYDCISHGEICLPGGAESE
ncbi:BRCA1 [Symbiodinium sp. CCMP2592]|nr:BRCA1 [Symbiodinium sp. CCMP2592]